MRTCTSQHRCIPDYYILLLYIHLYIHLLPPVQKQHLFIEWILHKWDQCHCIIIFDNFSLTCSTDDNRQLFSITFQSLSLDWTSRIPNRLIGGISDVQCNIVTYIKFITCGNKVKGSNKNGSKHKNFCCKIYYNWPALSHKKTCCIAHLYQCSIHQSPISGNTIDVCIDLDMIWAEPYSEEG